MTADQTVFTHWPPCEENEHEVIAQVERLIANDGVTAALAYIRKNYITGKRTKWATARGNVLMAKLLLIDGDPMGFLDFRYFARECEDQDTTFREIAQLGQMYAYWADTGYTIRWLPEKWQRSLMKRLLTREYPPLQ